jgi:hypothetical protein
MSRSFLHAYKHFIKIIDVDGKTLKLIPPQIYVGFVGTILGGHACYAYGTKSTDVIKVSNSYMYTQNGYTQFMIIDKSGKHYNVNNSFWYWKWNSIEDWHKINTADVIHVKYYGLRIPFLGMFPNIVSCQNIQDLPPPNENELVQKQQNEVHKVFVM